MSSPLVFPVGHWLGPLYRSGIEVCHRVRIGTGTVDLDDDTESAVWRLAHGEPEDPQPTTLGSVMAAAQGLGHPDAAAAADRLVDAGVLACVGTAGGALDAVRFARSHRLVALMVGLGDGPDGGAHAAIGPAGQPATWVTPAAFEAWRWGAATASLWELAELIGRAASQADGSVRNTEEVLGAVLAGLPLLLRVHAAYLDQAEP